MWKHIVVRECFIMFLIVSLALAILSFDAKAGAIHSDKCGVYFYMKEALALVYAEYPVVRARNKSASDFIEAYVSESGSWTLLQVDLENQIACNIMAGHSWEALDSSAGGDDPKPMIEMDEEPPKEIAA